MAVKKTTRKVTRKVAAQAPRPTKRTVISTELAPKAIGPYSQGIRVGDLIYTAGQAAVDPAVGKLIEGDISAQTRRTLQNIGAVLDVADIPVEGCEDDRVPHRHGEL